MTRSNLPGAGMIRMSACLPAVLVLLFPCLLFSAGDEQEVKEKAAGADLEVIVEYLLHHISGSGYTFIRNGSEHEAEDAVKHIRRKYEHYRKKIKTPEDFIRLSATKSKMSGKLYIVRTKEGQEIPCGEWLLDVLAAYRKGLPEAKCGDAKGDSSGGTMDQETGEEDTVKVRGRSAAAVKKR